MEKELKGKTLFDENKVRLINISKYGALFQVEGETENHFVYYSFTRKSWSCDCLYYMYKGKECSHIIAAKMLMKEIRKIIKNFL